MRRTFISTFLCIMLALAALMASQVSAMYLSKQTQSTPTLRPNITIFTNQNYLIIYVIDPMSLADIALKVTISGREERYFLVDDFAETVDLNTRVATQGWCLVYSVGQRPLLPSQCNEQTSFVKSIEAASRFWFIEPSTYRAISVIARDEREIAFCGTYANECSMRNETPTLTPTLTETPSLTPIPSQTPTPTPTPTTTETITFTHTPTNTLIPTDVPTITNTPTNTYTPTPTTVPTNTDTWTPSQEPSFTPTPTLTPTPEPRVFPPPPNTQPYLTFAGGRGLVTALAWAGDTLISAHANGELCVWDVVLLSPAPLQCVQAGQISTLEWNSHNNLIISAGDVLQVWRMNGGGASARLVPFAQASLGNQGLPLLDGAWSIDGQTIGTIGAWFSYDEREDRIFLYQNDLSRNIWESDDYITSNDPLAVDWSNTNESLVLIREDGYILGFNINDDNAIIGGYGRSNFGNSVSGLDIAQGVGNSIFTLSDNGELRIYPNVPSNGGIPGNGCNSNCFFARIAQNLVGATQIDGLNTQPPLIAVNTQTGVRIYSAQPPYVLQNIHTLPNGGAVSEIAFHASQPVLAGTDAIGTIYIWSVGQTSVSRTVRQSIFQLGSGITSAAWNSSSSYLILGEARNSQLSIWDVNSTPNPPQLISVARAHTVSPNTNLWSPIVPLMVSGGCDSRTIMWDMSDILAPVINAGEPNNLFNPNRNVAQCATALSFDSSGTQLAIGVSDAANGLNGRVLIWQFPFNQNHPRANGITMSQQINDLAWDNTNSRIAVASANGELAIFSATNGQTPLYQRQPSSQSPIPSLNALEWSPSGNLIATASEEGWIVIWDTRLTQNATTSGAGFFGGIELRANQGAVIDLSWEPNGTRLLSIHENGVFTVWDTQTASILAQEGTGSRDLSHIMWSPDGSRFAVVDTQGNVSIWTLN